MAARIEPDTTIDNRVAASLHEWSASTDFDLVVLPTRVRNNGVWYAEGDAETLKMARSEGLSVELLHEGSPTYLHEHSAGWYEELAIGIASGVTAPALIALGQVIRRKARAVIGRGVHAGSEDGVPFKLSVTRISRTGEKTELTSCEIEGSAADVIGGLPVVAQLLGLGELVEVEPADAVGTGTNDGASSINAELPDTGSPGQALPPAIPPSSATGAYDGTDSGRRQTVNP